MKTLTLKHWPLILFTLYSWYVHFCIWMVPTIRVFSFRHPNPCNIPSFCMNGWISPSCSNIHSSKGIALLKTLVQSESVDTCLLLCSHAEVQNQFHRVHSEFCSHCWKASPVFCQGPCPETLVERHIRIAVYEGNRASEEAVLGMQGLTGKSNSTFFYTRPEAVAQTSCCHSKYSTVSTICLTWEVWITVGTLTQSLNFLGIMWTPTSTKSSLRTHLFSVPAVLPNTEKFEMLLPVLLE